MESPRSGTETNAKDRSGYGIGMVRKWNKHWDRSGYGITTVRNWNKHQGQVRLWNHHGQELKQTPRTGQAMESSQSGSETNAKDRSCYGITTVRNWNKHQGQVRLWNHHGQELKQMPRTGQAMKSPCVRNWNKHQGQVRLCGITMDRNWHKHQVQVRPCIGQAMESLWPATNTDTKNRSGRHPGT